jgi:hypothetical protein
MASTRLQGPVVGDDDAPAMTPREELRFELEGRLIETDRVMMQTVQTALSLIGIGFSINAFFNDAVSRGLADQTDHAARRIGASLLLIGLFLLAGGIWTQAHYRAELLRRFLGWRMAGSWSAAFLHRPTPGFLSALMLLIVGAFALATALLRL